MTGLDLFQASWRKSSHSDSAGGTCIEVAAVWRKSSYSDSQLQECVEVAGLGWVVAVRDSKDPGGAVLAFSPGEWRGLLEAIKAG